VRTRWTHRGWRECGGCSKYYCRSRGCRSTANMDGPTPWSPDILTTFAATTTTKTSTVCLVTSVVQTYPRHPLVLAQQALSLYDIAPGRLRLGIGPSHRSIIEDIHGLPHRTPLAHLREYVEVLRAALWDRKVDHHGHFYNVVVTLPRT
jgi:alkanesulfonate monooxygenase SsuD/methylene tetrahydromethanopterin reductase-like flavin-dependent oxidoreductase (luciferase family)